MLGGIGLLILYELLNASSAHSTLHFYFIYVGIPPSRSFSALKGKYDDAEPLVKRALAIDEEKLSPDHPGGAKSLNNLATVWGSQVKVDVHMLHN